MYPSGLVFWGWFVLFLIRWRCTLIKQILHFWYILFFWGRDLMFLVCMWDARLNWRLFTYQWHIVVHKLYIYLNLNSHCAVQEQGKTILNHWRNRKTSVDKNNEHLIQFARFQVWCKGCNSSNILHNYSPTSQLTIPVMKLYFYI